MSETKTTRAGTTFMREDVHPAWPEDLEAGARRILAGSPAALREIRAAALEALRKTGLPQGKAEDFTFIRLNEFLSHLAAVPDHAADDRASRSRHVPKTATMPTLALIHSLIFPESRDNYVVLLDGEFSPGLSNPGPGFSVGPLEAAAPSPALVKRLAAALARETDAAASLADLFAIQPLLIQVEAKAAPSAPLQILHLRTHSQALRRDTFLIIAAGPQSESRILVRHAEAPTGQIPANASGSMSNIHSLLLLEASASVRWLEASPETPEGSGEADIHFHKLGALLERDSRLSTLTASTGARLARNAYAVDLLGQGAEAEIDGATVLAGNRQAHNYLQVRHMVPHGTSRQHFKTVAADKAKASVDGTVFVAEGAQLTNADQLINNLMLSDEARADSKPRLLIHADDVKCTHGATAGKLDPDQQFYLESRGLSAPQARTLLTLAFIAELLERADKALGAPGSGFRAHLDMTLLDTLKRRLGATSEAK